MSGEKRRRIMLIVTAQVTARLFLTGYAEHLSRNGFEVTLVADDLAGLEGALENGAVSVRSVPMRRDPSPWNDLVSLKRMRALIREIRPSAVVYATPKASLLAALASLSVRVPVRLYSLWGIRFETETGMKRTVLRALEWATAAASTSVVANSFSLAARAAELRIAPPEKIRVVGQGSSHGVDVERFAAAATMPEIDAATDRYLNESEGLTVGFVGRLHQDKGVDTLLAAVSQMLHDGAAVRTILVGADEGALPVARSRDAGRRPFHLAGEVDDVRPYLRVLDVLVLMSRREGYPNVVLEAAAMGVPAIVADSTGTVDSVVDGVTGVVVPVGDSARLAAVLQSFIAAPHIAPGMGAAARERAVERYSQEHVWALNASYVLTECQRRDGSR